MIKQPIMFTSQGDPLFGVLYRDTESLAERQPAVIVTGTWLSVKEQMAAAYAERLARLGYTTLIFDFAGFGESQSAPRQTEIPSRKIRNIMDAADFVSTLSFVVPDAVASLAVCASAQYTLAALARGAAIRSFASVAGWYHDTPSVAPFYGGMEGVARRLEKAGKAFQRYAAKGELDMAHAYEVGNEDAGMSFPLDYYGNPSRGAVPTWKNEMSLMTWLYWLTFDGLRPASRVSAPTLFVHGDGCVFPDNVKSVAERIGAPKTMLWTDGEQTDFYDREPFVTKAVAAAQEHFAKTLRS